MLSWLPSNVTLQREPCSDSNSLHGNTLEHEASRGVERKGSSVFFLSLTGVFFIWTSFLFIFKALLGAPLLCHHVSGKSVVVIQSYTEPGNPGLIAKHHHITAPELGTSTPLFYELDPGGEPASATKALINAGCGGWRFESALQREGISWKMLWWQPWCRYAEGAAGWMSLSSKREVAEGNSILEISSTSFRIFHTPTLPRNRFIGKRVGGGEMISSLLSQ